MNQHNTTYQELFDSSRHPHTEDYDAMLDTRLLVSQIVRAAKDLDGHQPWGMPCLQCRPWDAFSIPSSLVLR